MKKGIAVVVGAALFYLLIALYSNAEKLVEAFARMKIQFVAIALIFTLTNYFLRFVKWEVYCKKAGINISMKSSLLIFLGGMSMTITPGKAGELVKAYLLKKAQGVEFSRGAIVVVAERTTDLLAMISLAALGSVYFFLRGSFEMNLKSMVISLIILLSLVVMGIVFMRSKSFTNFLVRRFGISRKFDKVMKEVLCTRLTIEMTILSILSWMMECLALYITVGAFGLNISVFHAIFVFSVSTLAGVITMLPAGIGATELSMMYLLTRFGIPQLEASAITLVTRAVTLWLGVMIGVIALYTYGRREA